MLTLLLAVGGGFGQDEPSPAADAPVVAEISAGEVRGVVDSEQPIARLRAVSRVTGEQYAPASKDLETGRFRFAALPGNATYDLCVTLATGRRFQGVDLHWLEADLLRLAQRRREQLGMPTEPEGTFREGDADTILAWIRHRQDFFDIQRVLVLRGEGDRAVALVELLRTRSVADAGPEEDILWRVELWYFQRAGTVWERIANSEKLLERFRGPREQWRKIDVYYLPALSITLGPDGKVLSPAAGPGSQATSRPTGTEPASRPAMLRFVLPAEPSPATGRPAGTSPELATEPVLLLPE